ncbi:hypothetical protein V8C86DRAFT_2434656 [Haematococcus lacustris]
MRQPSPLPLQPCPSLPLAAASCQDALPLPAPRCYKLLGGRWLLGERWCSIRSLVPSLTKLYTTMVSNEGEVFGFTSRFQLAVHNTGWPNDTQLVLGGTTTHA